MWESLAHTLLNRQFGSWENSSIVVIMVVSGTRDRGIRKLQKVTRMLTDGVIIAIVNHTEFSHDVSTNSCFYGPIVYVTIFLFPVQFFYIKYLGTESVENDANVLDGEMVLLVYRQLVTSLMVMMMMMIFVIESRFNSGLGPGPRPPLPPPLHAATLGPHLRAEVKAE